MTDLRKAAEALIKHWEAGEFQNCTGDMAGHIRLLRQALAQPEWVEITKGEISEIWGNLPQTKDEEQDAITFGFAIEAKLKEKNL